jgi:hypothetical protein
LSWPRMRRRHMRMSTKELKHRVLRYDVEFIDGVPCIREAYYVLLHELKRRRSRAVIDSQGEEK